MGKTMKQLMCLCCLLLLAACTDELVTQQGEAVCPEGEPATVTLNVAVAGEQLMTRGLTEEEESQVNDLWVGFYDTTDKKLKYSKFFDDLDHNEQEPKTYRLSFNVTSGTYYIVAVANSKTIYGIMDGHPEKTFTGSDGNEYYNVYDVETGTAYKVGDETNFETIKGTTARPRLTVLTLLGMADTWESYKSISTVLSTPGIVTRSSANFPMSGFYREDVTPSETFQGDKPWFTDSGDIPDLQGKEKATVKDELQELPGCIHLRRVTSYSKFVIKAGDYVNVSPLSWQVVNVPSLSSLAERTASIGDTSKGLLERTEYKGSNYSNSATNPQFDKETVKETDADGNETSVTYPVFDFYLNENKHTGKSWVSTYTDRELEYKKEDGTNTGIYKALVADNKDATTYKEEDLNNNYATYVVLTCDVNYWYDNKKNGGVDYAPVDMTQITDNSDSRYLHRTGTATYVIHLGYCEGKTENGEPTAATARDFNACRNTKYTYNVTINGIDNIRVEAISKTGEEPQSGQEGLVSDLANSIFDLDCHYCVFNIKLSNSDRDNLGYVIQAYEDGKEWYYEHKSTNTTTTTTISNYKLNSGIEYPTGGTGRPYPQDVVEAKKMHFWDWIEFFPTEEGKLHTYPQTSSTDKKNRPWNLAMIGDPKNYPYDDDDNAYPVKRQNERNQQFQQRYNTWANKENWYTVFINENVYYYDYDGKSLLNSDGAISEWWQFTKQPDRRIWLINEGDPLFSQDQESKYIKAKFLFHQSSIDTYYSTVDYNSTHSLEYAIPDWSAKGYKSKTTNISPSAIGCEHVNESFGQNLRWGIPSKAWDASNGRWNTWLALGGDAETTTISGGYTWTGENAIADMDGTYMKPLKIDKDSRVNQTGAEITHAVYDMKNISNGTSDKDPVTTVNSPQYAAMFQCLSRNRDLDGDGKIDADEIRWYLPATRMYMRMMIGESALDEPFWDFSQEKFDVSNNGDDNYYNGFSHYITSNEQFVWAEEGMSLTTSASGEGRYWQLRCVRNLGADVSAIKQSSSIQPAYTYERKNGKDDGNWIFTMHFYDNINNRMLTPAALPTHLVNSSLNMTSYQFEIAPDDLKNANGNYVSNSNHITLITENNCDILNETDPVGGWRIPNYQELCLMMFLQNNDNIDLGLDTGQRYASCTQEYYPRTNEGSIKRVLTIAPAWYSTASSNYSCRIRCVRDVINQ